MSGYESVYIEGSIYLSGGPCNGKYIGSVEPSFEYNGNLSYTFAIEMQIPANVLGEATHLSGWALYDHKDGRAVFRAMEWSPPPNVVVVLGLVEL